MATSGSFSEALGTYTRYVVLANRSNHPCTLTGGPSAVTGITTQGKAVGLASAYIGAGQSTDNFNLIGPANLLPGQSAQVAISTAAAGFCPARSYAGSGSYGALAVSIGGTGQVKVVMPARTRFDAACGTSASAFGVPIPRQPALPRSPLNALTARISMPRTAVAGMTATYSVTLGNPTGRLVALSPCPSYLEFVDGRGGSNVLREYYLNCSAAPAIPARNSLTFQMTVPLPDRVGTTSLAWILQGTTVHAGGLLQVTAAAARS